MSETTAAPISELTDEESEKRTLGVFQRESGLGGLVKFLMTHGLRGVTVLRNRGSGRAKSL